MIDIRITKDDGADEAKVSSEIRNESKYGVLFHVASLVASLLKSMNPADAIIFEAILSEKLDNVETP